MAIGPVDRREGVHEGAVEIKEQRGEAAHGGRGRWRRAARETRKTWRIREDAGDAGDECDKRGGE